MTTTAWPSIELDERGVPSIEGTACKVLLLVEQHLTFGLDAVALAREFPALTAAQTHAASGYYNAHREECDALRQRLRDEAESVLNEVVDDRLQERLAQAKSAS